MCARWRRGEGEGVGDGGDNGERWRGRYRISRERNNNHTFEMSKREGATVASQTRRQDGEGKRA